MEIISPVGKFKILEGEKSRKRFNGEWCSFLPAGWVEIEGQEYPFGYKVVTEELKSLGLRRNPNILTYPPSLWVILTEDKIVPGISDWGGIWMSRTLGSANGLKKYCENKHNMVTRIFLSAMYLPLFANEGRVKSAGVMLIDEIFNNTQIS